MELKSGDRLLFATTNPGKLAEVRIILSDLALDLLDLSAFPPIAEPDETGDTFRANSELKAAYYAAQTGCWTIADDSGLEVSCLGGRPGVRSARYGGPDANYEQRISLLLQEVSAAGGADRSAGFVSSISLASPNGEVVSSFEGSCAGTLIDRPRGANGFGYDPIFAPAGFGQTFGELPDAVKRELSHRARALALFRAFLLDSLTVKA
jgi:XTP/dITP diphosphohydrolase